MFVFGFLIYISLKKNTQYAFLEVIKYLPNKRLDMSLSKKLILIAMRLIFFW